jgi:DNA-directed RNA polymerase subunit alpha
MYNFETSLDHSRETLLLEIWTRGAVTAKESLYLASALLEATFRRIKRLTSVPRIMTRDLTKRYEDLAPKPAELDLTIIPLETLKLSNRAYNALKNAGLRTIADITEKSTDDLLALKGCGTRSLSEIKKNMYKEYKIKM